MEICPEIPNDVHRTLASYMHGGWRFFPTLETDVGWFWMALDYVERGYWIPFRNGDYRAFKHIDQNPRG